MTAYVCYLLFHFANVLFPSNIFRAIMFATAASGVRGRRASTEEAQEKWGDLFSKAGSPLGKRFSKRFLDDCIALHPPAQGLHFLHLFQLDPNWEKAEAFAIVDMIINGAGVVKNQNMNALSTIMTASALILSVTMPILVEVDFSVVDTEISLPGANATTDDNMDALENWYVPFLNRSTLRVIVGVAGVAGLMNPCRCQPPVPK